jgi:hypothetical protein
MKEFIVLILFLSLNLSLKAQDKRSAVLQDLEKNQSTDQNAVSSATMKSASRLFADKHDLTSVILIIPSGSVVDVLDADSSYFHVLFDDYEGYITRRHAVLNNVPIVSKPVVRQEKPVRESIPVTQTQQSAQESRQASAQRNADRKAYLENKYGTDIASRILAMKVWKGMTTEMVLDSWGNPLKINRVISGNNVKEEWHYRSSLLYMENDYLIDWDTIR